MKIKINGVQVYDIYEGVLFQRGKMHRFPLEVKQEFVKQLSITAVVGLAGNEDPDFKNNMIVGIYQYFGIPDNKLTDRTINILDKFARKLSDHILEGGVVLTHCNAGRNRSGLLNAMIIMNLIGCAGSEAIEIVRRERPNALANEHFVNFLDSEYYAKR